LDPFVKNVKSARQVNQDHLTLMPFDEPKHALYQWGVFGVDIGASGDQIDSMLGGGLEHIVAKSSYEWPERPLAKVEYPPNDIDAGMSVEQLEASQAS
jgi:hypothetical protein